jgi:hypothetical protein
MIPFRGRRPRLDMHDDMTIDRNNGREYLGIC